MAVLTWSPISARPDPRFRLIRRARMAAPGAARNRALAEATGDFVTVHDPDDWSHPQKIALHYENLSASGLPFNVSAWVRATPELLFIGHWRLMGTLVQRNLSRPSSGATGGKGRQLGCSAHLRRRRIHQPCRSSTISARRNRSPPARCPRSGREDFPDPVGQTHVATVRHGIRREYLEAGIVGVRRLDPTKVLAEGLGRPPFPRRSQYGPPAPEPEHDLLLIGDFNMSGGTQRSAMNMMAAACRPGSTRPRCTIGAMTGRTKPLKHEVRQEARKEACASSPRARPSGAKTVVVTYPPILDVLMDRFPSRLRPPGDGGQPDGRARSRRSRRRLRPDAGARIWSSFSARKGLDTDFGARARTMEADPRYPAPIADTGPRRSTPISAPALPEWRGDWRARPVIGRHGRDHPLKWPADRETLRTAHCAGRPCEVRFLGGAVCARKRVGGWPANWRDEVLRGARRARLPRRSRLLPCISRSDHIEEFGRAPDGRRWRWACR